MWRHVEVRVAGISQRVAMLANTIADLAPADASSRHRQTLVKALADDIDAQLEALAHLAPMGTPSQQAEITGLVQELDALRTALNGDISPSSKQQAS